MTAPDDAVQFEYEGERIRFRSVSPGDHILRLMRAAGTFYERDVLERVRERLRAARRTGAAVDAGGFIGTHSVYFARACGLSPVLAFEANPSTYPLLVENVGANGLAEVVSCFQAALGAAPGLAAIVPAQQGNAGMTRVASATAGGGTVRMTTVDSELRARGVRSLAAVKIDVEGSELEVLEGAGEAIANHRPVLCVELHTIANLRAVLRRLRPHRYWIVDCLGHSPTYVLEPSPAGALRRATVNALWTLWAGTAAHRRWRPLIRSMAVAAGAGRAPPA